MKIYTRGGDRGFTGTLRGDRVPKSSQLMEALGTMDEFMTCCGLVKQALLTQDHCLAHMGDVERELFDAMDFIQVRIMSINGKLVGDDAADGVSEEDVKRVEDGLDRFSSELDSMKGFVTFGGGTISSYVQHARAVCRRAERELWRLPSHYLEHHSVTAQFINRISDWLFAFGYVLAQKGE